MTSCPIWVKMLSQEKRLNPIMNAFLDILHFEVHEYKLDREGFGQIYYRPSPHLIHLEFVMYF